MDKLSDSEVLIKKLSLQFGGKQYEVPMLRMIPAAEWRKHFFEKTQGAAAAISFSLDEKSPDVQKELSRAFFTSLFSFSEALPDLVFAYAPSLPKDEILAEAYDEDFVNAFKAIWGVAFQPFLTSLGMVIEMQKSKASRASASPSPEHLN